MMIEFTRKFLVPAFAGFLLFGCVNDDTGEPVAGEVDLTPALQAMVDNFADQIIIPNYEAVASHAATFSQASGSLALYCEALGTEQEAAARTVVQDDWQALALLIATVDLHAIGPVLDNGKLLLNLLNAYNEGELSACGVDQATVQNALESDFSIANKVSNQRGIGALEFLLFNQDFTFSCPGAVSQTAQWNALTEQEQKVLRCDYAQIVLGDMVQSADAIVNQWLPSGGDYRADFVSSDGLEDTFSALSDAFFALEDITKDRKLGESLGIRSTCAALVCPEAIEAPYSEYSLATIESNLLAFEQVFFGRDALGAEGQGFDDIIIANGFESIVSAMTAALNDALDYLALIRAGDSLSAQVNAIVAAGDDTACVNSNANPETVQTVPACALHGYIKRITDILRTDFLLAVNLDLPDSTQGDND